MLKVFALVLVVAVAAAAAPGQKKPRNDGFLFVSDNGGEGPGTSAVRLFSPAEFSKKERDKLNPGERPVVIFNSDTKALEFWNGSVWMRVVAVEP